MRIYLEENQKKIIVCVIIVVILIVLIAILTRKDDKKVNMMEIISNYDSDISVSESFETEFREKIKNAFEEVQSQYNEGKKINSKVTLDAYYNETRLNMAMEDGEIEFVSVNDIATEDLNLYNIDGNLITEVPNLTFNGEEVEISTSSIIEAEKYYLLRTNSLDSIYTFYYIVKFNKLGTISIDWLCYTENEITDDDMEIDIENEF